MIGESGWEIILFPQCTRRDQGWEEGTLGKGGRPWVQPGNYPLCAKLKEAQGGTRLAEVLGSSVHTRQALCQSRHTLVAGLGISRVCNRADLHGHRTGFIRVGQEEEQKGGPQQTSLKTEPGNRS